MSEHGPAHRNGCCGVVGVDWVYASPAEMDKARQDAAAVARVAALVAHARLISPSDRMNLAVADVAAALGGDPE